MSPHPALAPYSHAEFQSTWTADYLLRKPDASPARLVVLLHGYSLRGEWIFHKLEKSIPPDAIVLAPSAPFPVINRKPGQARETYSLGYSWYFYDRTQDEYLLDMTIGTDFVVNLVRHLGWGHLPTTIVGFSQGGFLAPFVAAQLPSCHQVVGLAAEFLMDELPEAILPRMLKSVRMDQIHGELDDTVLLKDAVDKHRRLKELGFAGDFKIIPGLGHRIEDEMKSALSDIFNNN